ncbi:Signal transduction histidine kinase [Amycolatopsis xylanica]|uniref:Signal transduction histidine kinase n=1 Tax=Amycolatopsis xylanica TaxID=589385 RepID=A0A1H2YDM5_9PSEU|nr:sensor histidine kinase [Amycolatopsis xylanica]SDX02938.1 Signal transduction histidine kinase [Amycolatopsis xylanica]
MDEQRPVDIWDRWYWIWEIYFAVAYLATIALILINDATDAAKLVSSAALTGIVVAYVLLGRRSVRDHEPKGKGYLFGVIVLVLFLIAVVSCSATGYALFAICPMAFMTQPVGMASALTGLLVLTPVVSVVVHNGFGDPALGTLLPMSALMIVFGVFIGRWITKVIEQSKERAELIEKLEASQAEVARLSREAGTAAERERLAREIHDTLAQGFTSIVTLTQAIESEMDTDAAAAKRHLALAARTARENLAEARAMVAALTPSALAAGTLEDAIRRQAERLGEESALRVNCVISPLPPLGTAAEVVVLRAAQEALTNIVKHAAASTVELRLAASGGVVRLMVIDDGAGFDTAEPSEGFGLRGMRARAEQVGGSLTIQSGRSEGTTVTLEVPA